MLWLLQWNTNVQAALTEGGRASAASVPSGWSFAPLLPLEGHLSRLAHADVYLDAWPCNAHTTAGEALWVGVPVVTIEGPTFAQRVASSLLRTSGLPELVCGDVDAYRATVVALAGDTGRAAPRCARACTPSDRPAGCSTVPRFAARHRAALPTHVGTRAIAGDAARAPAAAEAARLDEERRMKAVILAGGLGTRLAEETSVRPKPMVEIGGKPVLWHILKSYSHHGINDFVICLGYRGYLIKEYFANYFLHMSDVTFDLAENRMEVCHRHCEPWRVTLVDTGEQTQTGGRLRRVARLRRRRRPSASPTATACRTSTSARSIRFHREQKRLATLTAVQPAGRFGALDIEDKQHHALRGEAAGRRQLDQRRLLRPRARGAARTSTTTPPSGSASRSSGSPATASSRPSPTAASGSRWTRCATRCGSRTSGNRARRRGRSGQ